MWYHYLTLLFMLLWMTAPLLVYQQASRKQRDPYLWIAGATLLGPLVALVFLSLPRRQVS